MLHLIEDLGAGGAERLLYVNLARIDRTRFDGTVCHLYDRALHWRDPIRSLGYPVMSLGIESNRDLPRAFVRLWKWLRHERVDVIHTHLYGANLVGRAAGAVRGIPVVSSLHNPDYEPETCRDNAALSRSKLRALCWVDRATCRMVRPRFVAVSQFVKGSAVRHLHIDDASVEVIYNPIDFTMFAPSPEISARARALRAGLGLHDREPVLLNVARLDPQKGQRYLIEAVALLAQRFPGLTALFVGGGSPAAKAGLAERAAALGVAARVRLLGVQADVRPYLDLCDLFVLPSLYEGMGIALVEAMAMERACIASRAAAIPEVVADQVSGLLVTPGSAAELGDAIERTLSNAPLRTRMGVEGRRLALERFDVTRNIAQLESVYERVAGRRAA